MVAAGHPIEVVLVPLKETLPMMGPVPAMILDLVEDLVHFKVMQQGRGYRCGSQGESGGPTSLGVSGSRPSTPDQNMNP